MSQIDRKAVKGFTREFVESYQLENFCSKLMLSPLAEAIQGCDFIVADSNTAQLLPVPPDLILPPGEQHKTLAEVEQLLGAFAARRLLRNSTVLAFGGGVLCDLVGFAAASYMRGCGLILVPTTLLSMVDAGLGGKTACNYQNYKNMIGAFYPASEVRIVPEVLGTLPSREFRSGLAELCKHALLSDTDALWQNLQQHKDVLQTQALERSELRELLIEGVRVKGEVVQRDLYERGERAFLNLGHTYAHALEKVSSFACTHGEAVAWGINQALHLSTLRGDCAPGYAAEVRELLLAMGFVLNLRDLCPALFLDSRPSEVAEELLAAMELDKKRSQSGIRLVLQQGRGQTFVVGLPQELILKALQL